MDSFDQQRKFVKEFFSSEKSGPFFSFMYDGRDITTDRLPAPVVERVASPDCEQITATYKIGPDCIQLRIVFRVYTNFPMIEYIPWFENTGKEKSGIIEDVKVLDLTTELPPQHKTFGFLDGTCVTVRRNLGSCSDRNDFIGCEEKLWSRPGSNKIVIDNAEGRCSTMFLPYFGVDLSTKSGLNFGVGWSGSWKAEIEQLVYSGPYWHAEKVRISFGMRKTHFALLPHESLRQPGCLIQFRDQESVRDGQNTFRRFMLSCHAPHDKSGKLLVPPAALVTWGGLPTSDMQRRITALQQEKLPYEAYWVDAGWSGYPGPCPHFLDDPFSDWPRRVGNWAINSYPHPDGLKPVSDCAHAAGMKFLLWFEPERIHAKSRSPLLQEHPEWLHRSPESDHWLYDLGDSQARDHLLEKLTELIDSQGVDIYREDFNIDPAPIWGTMDAPDRIGVSEMKHVAGHYELWERLRMRYPDMPVDNCSSGGRRLDYLSLTHSFPLCQSDYGCFHDYDRDMMQVENFYLDDWIPLHSGFCWLPDGDWYDFLSCLGTGLSSKIWCYASRDIPKNDHYDWNEHRKMIETAKRLRALLVSGYIYPLTDHPENPENWCARQIHDREASEGAVIAFRREKSLDETVFLPLSEIEPESHYLLTDLQGNNSTCLGAVLKKRLKITLQTSRSVQLLWYKKKNFD